MAVSDILSEDAVLFCTDIASKQQLLEAIAEHAGRLLGQRPEAILETLSNREALGSTGLGDGIAIPHGKLSGLSRVMAIFVRLATPVEFDAVDDQPVDLVVALLAPPGAGAEHLKALSRMARALRSDDTVAQLRSTADPARLYAILTAPAAADRAA